MRIFFLLIAIFSGTGLTYSQEWAQTYNGPGSLSDNGNAITTDGLGNVYVTGPSTGSGTGNDIVTIKYNSDGVQQWVQRYNGAGNSDDIGRSITVDNQNNVYVAGASTGSGSLYDMTIIKYNSDGIEQWVKIYNGPGNKVDIAVQVITDDSNNVYITGWSSRGGALYDLDYATIKYNSAGVEQWVARYSGPVSLNNSANAIALDDSGNVYVTGSSEGGITTSNYDYATIKYNPAGNQQWVARYDSPLNKIDVANSIALDNSGNVYVTGSSDSGSAQDDECVTIKYNSSGTQQWLKKYSGPNFGDEIGSIVKVDQQGDIYVAGERNGPGTGQDYLVIKYNPLGDSLWVRTYNGPGDDTDRIFSMELDNSGNVYVTGYSWTGFLPSTADYLTIKYNSSGAQQWLRRYNAPGNGTDQAKSIAIDNSGNVYVTGFTSASSQDITTIKYSVNTAIEPISNIIPDNFSLSQNYPNPFNPMTKIKFDIPKAFNTKLAVYDILGKEVAVLVNDNLKPGSYEVELNSADLPSGTYFYRLVTDGFTETKKMTLIK